MKNTYSLLLRDIRGVLLGVLCTFGLGLSVNAGTTITTFDAPGAGTGAGQGTLPESNNTVGAITGNSIDGNFVNHGFLLNQQGSVSVFDVPGTGTGAGQGTIPVDNNIPGAIIGEAIDGGSVIHGFLVEGL